MRARVPCPQWDWNKRGGKWNWGSSLPSSHTQPHSNWSKCFILFVAEGRGREGFICGFEWNTIHDYSKETRGGGRAKKSPIIDFVGTLSGLTSNLALELGLWMWVVHWIPEGKSHFFARSILIIPSLSDPIKFLALEPENFALFIHSPQRAPSIFKHHSSKSVQFKKISKSIFPFLESFESPCWNRLFMFSKHNQFET